MDKNKNSEIAKLKQNLVLLIMQKNSNNLKDTSKIKKIRKDIARLMHSGSR